MTSTYPLVRKTASVAIFVLAACMAAGIALAQSYPSKNVRLIVPAPAGSAPDFLSRLIGQKLGEMWGQPVVIDNIVGAGGNMGTERAAKATPDGHTLLFNTIGPIAVNISMYDKLPFDPVKDFAPVTLVAKVPNILVVHPSLPVRNVEELIAYAKKNPGKLRYGSPGSGTSNHLSAELLNTMTGISMLHIPYKSSAQMTIDVMGGHVDVVFHNAPVLLPHVKSGALRGLAVTSLKRNASVAELPPMAEAGVPGYEVTAWFGVLAPAGTPQVVISKLHADIVKTMAMSDVKERMLAQAAEPVGNTPQEYAAFIASEIAKWSKVVKASGAKVE